MSSCFATGLEQLKLLKSCGRLILPDMSLKSHTSQGRDDIKRINRVFGGY